MRKLASIQRIDNIEPIEGADRIELASVLGWKVVVKKGEFKKGDLGVYFEIDSFLPMKKEFEFLRNSSYKKSDLMGEGYRLRTQKMRGVISQGLLLPLGILPEKAELGDDVTEMLGVRKWEIEERATSGGTVIGNLPPDVPHTDETRVQACPELIKEFGNYYISTKMDGSSHSISVDVNGIHVTGHNYEYSDGSFYEFAEKRGYLKKISSYAARKNIKTLTLQGEYCGPGLQKNRLKLIKPEWYVFTVRVNGKRLGLAAMSEILNDLSILMVPVEEVGEDFSKRYPTVEAVLKRAEGEYPNGGQKEGIVIRPLEPEWCSLIGAELSMKAVNNKYLIKEQ